VDDRLERTIVHIHLLLHGGGVWRKARKKVYSSEVPPIATRAAVHLQQHSLPRRVLQVRIKQYDGVVNIFIESTSEIQKSMRSYCRDTTST